MIVFYNSDIYNKFIFKEGFDLYLSRHPLRLFITRQLYMTKSFAVIMSNKTNKAFHLKTLTEQLKKTNAKL